MEEGRRLAQRSVKDPGHVVRHRCRPIARASDGELFTSLPYIPISESYFRYITALDFPLNLTTSLV